MRGGVWGGGGWVTRSGIKVIIGPLQNVQWRKSTHRTFRSRVTELEIAKRQFDFVLTTCGHSATRMRYSFFHTSFLSRVIFMFYTESNQLFNTVLGLYDVVPAGGIFIIWWLAASLI
jgi:hypothetical protein